MFEQRDRGLAVDVRGPDAEIPRPQYGLVRLGVDRAQLAQTCLLRSRHPCAHVAGDGHGDFALEGEDVAQVALIEF